MCKAPSRSKGLRWRNIYISMSYLKCSPPRKSPTTGQNRAKMVRGKSVAARIESIFAAFHPTNPPHPNLRDWSRKAEWLGHKSIHRRSEMHP